MLVCRADLCVHYDLVMTFAVYHASHLLSQTMMFVIYNGSNINVIIDCVTLRLSHDVTNVNFGLRSFLLLLFFTIDYETTWYSVCFHIYIIYSKLNFDFNSKFNHVNRVIKQISTKPEIAQIQFELGHFLHSLKVNSTARTAS